MEEEEDEEDTAEGPVVKGFENEGEVGVEGSSGKTSASRREKVGSIRVDIRSVVVVGRGKERTARGEKGSTSSRRVQGFDRPSCLRVSNQHPRRRVLVSMDVGFAT